jgi:hypothetical protein
MGPLWREGRYCWSRRWRNQHTAPPRQYSEPAMACSNGERRHFGRALANFTIPNLPRLEDARLKAGSVEFVRDADTSDVVASGNSRASRFWGCAPCPKGGFAIVWSALLRVARSGGVMRWLNAFSAAAFVSRASRCTLASSPTRRGAHDRATARDVQWQPSRRR